MCKGSYSKKYLETNRKVLRCFSTILKKSKTNVLSESFAFVRRSDIFLKKIFKNRRNKKKYFNNFVAILL